jgi:hypothetical protein
MKPSPVSVHDEQRLALVRRERAVAVEQFLLGEQDFQRERAE